MELKSNEYQIECTPYGEYYAFLTDYHQCCTYGETAEEALETCQISPMSFSAK